MPIVLILRLGAYRTYVFRAIMHKFAVGSPYSPVLYDEEAKDSIYIISRHLNPQSPTPLAYVSINFGIYRDINPSKFAKSNIPAFILLILTTVRPWTSTLLISTFDALSAW